jgi:3-methyladenine DNA glycosylase AlkD
MIKTIRNNIKQNSESKFATFTQRLNINTSKYINGVRLPFIRKLSNKIAKNIKTFEKLKKLEQQINYNDFEETLIIGIIISYCKNVCFEKRLKLLNKWVKKVDDWSFTDSIITSIKPTDKEIAYLYWFVIKNSKRVNLQQFERRFYILLLKNYCLNKNYVNTKFFDLIYTLFSNEYYVQMAIAWLFADYSCIFFCDSLKQLKNAVNNQKIDIWTYKKSLQKMMESNRISNIQKKIISNIR